VKTTSVLRLSARTLYQPRAVGFADRFFADDKTTGRAPPGQVISEAEGAMEGVVVTAHKDGSIVSVSVTTDARGPVNAFPENKLVPWRVQDHDPRSGLRD